MITSKDVRTIDNAIEDLEQIVDELKISNKDDQECLRNNIRNAIVELSRYLFQNSVKYQEYED